MENIEIENNENIDNVEVKKKYKDYSIEEKRAYHRVAIKRSAGSVKVNCEICGGKYVRYNKLKHDNCNKHLAKLYLMNIKK